jgi:adenylate cyclase, class 1
MGFSRFLNHAKGIINCNAFDSGITTNSMKYKQYLDKKYIRDIQRRFVKTNAERFRCAKSATTERGNNFLDVLPLLLHANHPILPGYVSQNTPCSIYDYYPDQAAVRGAKTIAKNFSLQNKAHLTKDILSIFLMGSSGSIAHGSGSDFDVWVVVRDGISESLLSELELKLNRISKWADSINVEAHFFIMKCDHFREDINVNAEGEHCGTAQHFLLLDEFYRTAVHVAGRWPVWWLVPPEVEDHDLFCEELKLDCVVDMDDYIDFGGIGKLPANEYLGAGLWHLYKAIDNPYKSVLKLMLMETYAAEYPDTLALSASYKQLVYRGVKDINDIDSYVMIFRRIERFFIRNKEWRRLEFLRECFYLKIGERLSQAKSGLLSWRQEVMNDLVNQWNWNSQQIQYLDSRPKWKISEVAAERKRLVQELNVSYRFLSNFARGHQEMVKISQKDITKLGRKLHATFERRSGKIERLNTGIATDLIELELTITAQQKNSLQSWALFDRALKSNELSKFQPLKRTHHLVELITWSEFNQLLGQKSGFQILDNKLTTLNTSELGILRRAIRDAISPEIAQRIEDFDNPATNKVFLMIINAGIDPFGDGSGEQIITNQSDVFSYGESHKNLVRSIDLVIVNSWKEVLVWHFEGETCLADAIAEMMLLMPQQRSDIDYLDVTCFGAARREQIQKRVNQLIEKNIDIRFSQTYAMFATQIGDEMVSIIYEPEAVYPIIHQNETKWIEYLSTSKPQQFSLYIDDGSQLQRPIKTMVNNHQWGEISLFYKVGRDMAHIYLLDENGVYFYRKQEFHDLTSLLQPFARFILAVNKRMDTQRIAPTIKCSELMMQDGEIVASLSRVSLTSAQKHYFNIEVIAEKDGKNPELTFYCDHREFSALEYGNKLLEAVAKHILKQRQFGEYYPAYITDLDLSGIYSDQKLSTSVYLRHKTLLEYKLNEAIKKFY